jgi:hypothetical protein
MRVHDVSPECAEAARDLPASGEVSPVRETECPNVDAGAFQCPYERMLVGVDPDVEPADHAYLVAPPM